MRVTLLAAAMLCFMGLPASAQPMTPDSSGLGAITGAMRYADSPWLTMPCTTSAPIPRDGNGNGAPSR